MTTNEIYQFLSKKYPVEYRSEWDNDGIMVSSNPEHVVKKILLALDVTNEVADYAVENHFDMIISHHPLVFHSLKSCSFLELTFSIIHKLLKNEVDVLSFHTRLDTADNGVNDCLALALNLENVHKIGPDNQPLGRIGQLKSDMPIEKFCQLVKQNTKASVVNYVAAFPCVHHVAVVGGDGKDFIEYAKKSGADTFVSGHIGYNAMIMAKEYGISLIEAGHFFTENLVLASLERELKKLDSSFAILKMDSNNIKVIY